MKFTVYWTPDAERDLAELWLNEPHLKADITQAADEVDRLLRRDPEREGESRFEAARILFVPPLVVDYQVSPDDLRVDVIGLTLLP